MTGLANGRLPAGSTDCHMHVFGPGDRYPLLASRRYRPQEASLADYAAMAGGVGLERIVFVQPSPYGTDNSCMLDALREVGPRGRGVAVIDAATPEAELDRMHDAGVRGIRINAETYGLHDPEAIGAVLRVLAGRVRRLGWHVQLFAALETLAALAPVIAALEVPVVIDHMGLARAGNGTGHVAFEALLRLVENGVWIKLSAPYRISDAGPDFTDAGPIAAALIAANAERVVWGSDWPHTGKHTGASDPDAVLPHRSIDDVLVLERLRDWAGTPAQLDRILVHNPARLYGF